MVLNFIGGNNMITAEFINSKKKVYSMDFDGLDSFITYYFNTSHDTKLHNVIKGKEIILGGKIL